MNTLWFLVAISLSWAEAFNVLVVVPLPAKSHGILGDAMVNLLLEAGHEVTYITPFPKDDVHPKLRQVDVSSNGNSKTPLNIKAIMDKKRDMFDPRKYFNMTMGVQLATISHPNVRSLLNDTSVSFDVVISEWMFSELYAGFAAVYDCPHIWLCTAEPHSLMLGLIDEGLNPSYNSGLISPITPPFDFVQRVKELGVHLLLTALRALSFGETERREYEAHFGPAILNRGRQIPSFEVLRYNTSLVLGNSHVSLGQPTRLPQNFKPVGGYHIDPEIKPLPKDLKQIMDNAQNGVVYFSMGTNLRSKDMPDEIKKGLLKVFGALKYTIIWKFEETLANVPSNVHMVQWAPQASILAHPNCVLFVSHGGLLSMTEAVYFGKPVVGIPVFADQFINVQRTINKGYGRKVELSYNMAADLKITIEEVLSDPKYAAKAKELSFIYHHRPVSPAAELVHWVEHVVHTGGAPHLRSPALDLPLYQKCYLDLIATMLAPIIFLYVLIRQCSTTSIKKPEKSYKMKAQ